LSEREELQGKIVGEILKTNQDLKTMEEMTPLEEREEHWARRYNYQLGRLEGLKLALGIVLGISGNVSVNQYGEILFNGKPVVKLRPQTFYKE